MKKLAIALVVILAACTGIQSPEMQYARAQAKEYYKEYRVQKWSEYPATAAAQVVLWADAGKSMDMADAMRYQEGPEKEVGHIVEATLTRGGDNYQLIFYFENGAKKLQHLRGYHK